jgi:hypothetical protein
MDPPPVGPFLGSRCTYEYNKKKNRCYNIPVVEFHTERYQKGIGTKIEF